MRYEAIAVPLPERTELPSSGSRRWLLAVLGLWIAAGAFLISIHLGDIAAQAYTDVDDRLRLVQVRDWLDGQPFRDVSQHRMNPPAGAPMHWSRLVDMPIAAVQIAARPLVGRMAAETVSAVIVPFLTLGLVMLAVALLARRIASPAAGVVAAALLPVTPATLPQLAPLRVDHHGWGIMLSLLAAWSVLDRRGLRSGLVTGGALALALQISLEAMPFAAAVGAVAGVRYVLAPSREEGLRLAVFATTLAALSTLMFLILHAPADRGGWCDAISPPQLVALGIVAAGCTIVSRMAIARRAGRIAALAGVAALAAVAYRALPPHCGADSFSMLEPIVRENWWLRVPEGQPAWCRGAAVTVALLGFPAIGLACAVWRTRCDGDRRAEWLSYLVLLVAATAVGIGVTRATGLANAIAIPAAASTIVALVPLARRARSFLVRVAGSAGIVLVFNPWAPAVAGSLIPTYRALPDPSLPCTTRPALAALDTIPPSLMFSSLDLAPTILFGTRHEALASGHHRNHVAMAATMEAWLGDDGTARRILRAHGMTAVLVCPGEIELKSYARSAPAGFAAHLLSGHAPAWLRRVPLPGTPARVWTIDPAA